jgi:hypothetical protein
MEKEMTPKEFMNTNEYKMKRNEMQLFINKDNYKIIGNKYQKTEEEKLQLKLAKKLNKSK